MPVYCNKAKEDKIQNILDLANVSIYITVEVLGTLFGHIIFISTYYLNLKRIIYSVELITILMNLV